jgi:phage-related protein
MPGPDAAIVAFEHATLGSAVDELRSLGLDVVTDFLLYLQEVQSGKQDHRGLLPFYEYGGVLFFLANVDSDLVVFGVETDELEDIRITVMFAGEFGKPISVGLCNWNGYDYNALISQVIHPRATVWYT